METQLAVGIFQGPSQLGHLSYPLQWLGPEDESSQAHAKRDCGNIPTEEKAKIRE